ncbi:MAG: acyltransferase [Janthinobacterium lividum]
MSQMEALAPAATPQAARAGGGQRNLGMDLLRVLATYMVMQIHTGEFFYIGKDGAVLNTPDAHWVGWLNSLCRTCVPLFVMISGYFLFPVLGTRQFLRKRFTRVLFPFVIWCAVYAFYYYAKGESTLHKALINVLHIPVNYGVEVGHLWFVYMLLGLYLFAPVLSPWVQGASRRSLEGFLLLWGIASTTPYLHLWAPEVWGEAFWNVNPTLYLFTGYLGYIVAAVYIRRFHSEPSSKKTLLAWILIALGYAVTATGFLHRLGTEVAVPKLELTWGFTTLNVEMMTVGIFLLLMRPDPFRGNRARRVLHDVAARSYGMYLAHIIVLNAVFGLLAPHLNTALLALPVIALPTFVLTYLAVKAISYLPWSKWVVG